jgi:hypothetical protein
MASVETREAAHDAGTLFSFYNAGAQLYLSTTALPGVRDWVRQLAVDLGKVGSTGRGDIYATKKIGGLGWHFDTNDNFTIQLVGAKRWDYSDTQNIVAPLSNASDRPVGFPDRATLSRPKGPRNPNSVLLQPGDMFYVPRGFWHRTETTRGSLSFDLNIAPGPWLDTFLRTIHSRLARSEHWRASAVLDRDAAQARLESMRALLDEIQPEDIVTVPRKVCRGVVDAGTMLRRNPLADWALVSIDKKLGEALVEINTFDTSSVEQTISLEFLTILREVDRRPTVRVQALLRRWRHDDQAALEFLDSLVAAGLLHVVETTRGHSGPA